MTDKLMPLTKDLQSIPLSAVYPVIFIETAQFSVSDNGTVKNKTAYILIGINEDGMKELLSIEISDNENSEFWLGVLNSLKNRYTEDIFIVCADGLAGIKESLAAVFPEAEYQHCIIHQAKNTLRHVATKDKKEFADDLKSIYHAPAEAARFENMQKVSEKWSEKYPDSMKAWLDDWDCIHPIFRLPADVLKVIYITNAIEKLNNQYRKLSRDISVFPSDTALLMPVYNHL